MASKLSGWIDEAVGAALVAAGVVAVWYCPALAPYLISAGVGLMMTGIGTLIAGLGGLTGVHTLSRNPVKPWDVVYGRARVSGTNIYTHEWGNNKYVDIVAVLACHPCKDIYGVLFNGRMVQIDTTAVPSGVPASTFPAINGGTSFSPVQESHTCSSIIRANRVVTVITQDIPLLIPNEYVRMSEVTADTTLNGSFAVSAILGRSGGNITFQYICGGAPIIISGSQGRITTMWVDYGRHVYIETMLGTQTLGTTFVGMTIGTPNEGDPSDLQHPPVNPWTTNCSGVGKTLVFIRLNYDSTIFANGIPQISFLMHGKNDISDPRTSPATVGYSENSALCFADYMTNQVYGFRCAYGAEINLTDLASDANVCDEDVPLAIGGAEPRYTCNGQFELSMTRGEILQRLLSSCGGRLTTAAGRFRCNPATWPGTSLSLAAPDPSATPGWGGPIPDGIGWTQRANTANTLRLSVWDALAPATSRYSGNANWNPTCNVTNLLALVSLQGVPGSKPESVQVASSSSGFVGGGFSTWTQAFASANTAGNTLVVDIVFGANFPISGVTVTDTNGNYYYPLYMAEVFGDSSAICCFVAVGCRGGANTVTVTQTGLFNFQSISVSVQEYANLYPSFPAITGTATAEPHPGDFVTRLLGAPFAPWMIGCPITFNGIPYSINGGLTSGAMTAGYCTIGAIIAPVTAGWVLGYSNDIGWFFVCNGICNAQIALNGGAHANSISLAVVAQANSVLRLVAGTLQDCSGGPTSIGGGAPETTGPMQILASPFRWRPKVSVHDLFNAVKGTYVSPVTNWQAADFPPYAQDTLHGYFSGSPMVPYGDANLAEDDGQRRYLDIQLPFTISASTAQRLAKIELLRRRQQGTGTFPFNLYGTQLSALDVVAMTLPYFGWVGKLLEVAAWRFTFTERNGAVALATEIDAQETDPSVYDWSSGTEDLTPQGYASPGSDPPGTGSNVTSIVGPTGVTLLSDATTAGVGGGGIDQSQIKVSWTAPADAYVSYIQIQYQVYSSPLGASWLPGTNAPPNVTAAFIPNVTNGVSYEVQIRSVDVNGAASPWAQYGPVVAGGATGQLFTVNGT